MLNFKSKKSKVNGCHSIWVKSSGVLDPDLQRKDTTFRKEEIKKYSHQISGYYLKTSKDLPSNLGKIFFRYFVHVCSMIQKIFRL